MMHGKRLIRSSNQVSPQTTNSQRSSMAKLHQNLSPQNYQQKMDQQQQLSNTKLAQMRAISLMESKFNQVLEGES